MLTKTAYISDSTIGRHSLVFFPLRERDKPCRAIEWCNRPRRINGVCDNQQVMRVVNPQNSVDKALRLQRRVMMSNTYVVLRKSLMSEEPLLVPAGAQSSRPSIGFTMDVLDAHSAAAAAQAPDFEAAAPSMPMKLIAPMSAHGGAPMPPPSDVAWGVRAVGAHSSPFTGTGIVVAVLDTGIDAIHPAFAGVELIERDFTGEGNGDEEGHGTHCAGTIFGRDVDSVRVGVARGVTKALIGKVLGRSSGSSEHIVKAIQWALENGANVISMSLGIDFPGHQLRLQRQGFKPEVATSLALEGYRLNVQLFDRLGSLVSALAAFRQPCLLIAATGNESGRDQDPAFEIAASPPAVADGFIAVAALQAAQRGFEVATFSNTGAAVAAPGVSILSAKAGGGLVALSGTSMATPHVAGVAALWAEKLKAEHRFSIQQFEASLLGSATLKTIHPVAASAAIGAGIVSAPQD